MAVVKQAVFLLLLLAISTYADHHLGQADHADHHGDQKEQADHVDCETLNKALHSKDLHKSFGDWVLVYGIVEHREDLDALRKLSSSHIEVRLLDDNKTVTHKEWNTYTDGSCDSFFIKTSLAENRADYDHHILPINGYHYGKNGEVEWYNDVLELQFFQTCDDCLYTIFKTDGPRQLLHYRRKDHPIDVAQLRAHDRQAECLKFSHEEKFIYKGAAETCHKETPQAFKDHLEQRQHHGGSGPNDQEQ